MVPSLKRLEWLVPLVLLSSAGVARAQSETSLYSYDLRNTLFLSAESVYQARTGAFRRGAENLWVGYYFDAPLSLFLSVPFSQTYVRSDPSTGPSTTSYRLERPQITGLWSLNLSSGTLKLGVTSSLPFTLRLDRTERGDLPRILDVSLAAAWTKVTDPILWVTRLQATRSFPLNSWSGSAQIGGALSENILFVVNESVNLSAGFGLGIASGDPAIEQFFVTGGLNYLFSPRDELKVYFMNVYGGAQSLPGVGISYVRCLSFGEEPPPSTPIPPPKTPR